MARSIWQGAISFGLVSVPVKLYSAVTPKNVRFNQLNSETGARVKQKRVDAGTDEEVAFENIVKGYELSPDRYITITPEELEGVAPQKTKSIAIEAFVDAGQIDPLVYDASYYLSPADPSAEKPYRMLAQAMQSSGRVAIGRLVLRTKEKLVAMRPVGGIFVCSTLVWADEVNTTAGLEPQSSMEPTEQELGMAAMLIDSLTAQFDHAAYKDTYRDQVLALIAAKANGETIETTTEEVQAPAPDLMLALSQSLEAQKPKAKPAKAKAKVAA